jgi:hypothetical protein
MASELSCEYTKCLFSYVERTDSATFRERDKEDVSFQYLKQDDVSGVSTHNNKLYWSLERL